MAASTWRERCLPCDHDSHRFGSEGNVRMNLEVAGVLFGGFAVILALPFTSAVATLIDVLVLGHEPPAEQPRRSLRLRRWLPR
jgi:hypothetical protein